MSDDLGRVETPYSLAGKRIWVAGHGGMVGSAIVRRLARIDCELLTSTRGDADLRRQGEVEDWMEANKPQAVFLAAATVGGIWANATRPAEFIYDNLMIETNVINAARDIGVEKMLVMGSACIYPRMAPQPIPEDALLTGPLELTNEAYAVAKIAGIKMSEAYRTQYGCDFICAQPNNLFGPGDNFDLENSHVVPALMAKAHAAKLSGAKSMEVWGTGSPLREFLFIDDLADALVFLMENYSGPVQVNIGSGEEMTIRQLAETVIDVVGFEGELVFNTDKPDGTPRKLLDVSHLKELGWSPRTSVRAGLEATYRWFLENGDRLRSGR